MAELITAIRDYAAWLYALVGLLIVRELLVMLRSGRDHRRALFSLEREAATGRATRSAVMLLLLLTMGVGIYTVARIVAPSLSERERRMVAEAPIIETPRPIGLPSDTPVPRAASTATGRPVRIVTARPPADGSPTPDAPIALCRNPNVDIVAPSAGALVDADLPVVVSVRFDPAEGRSYKLEIGPGANPAHWSLLAGPLVEPVTESMVFALSPKALLPGIYTLRLSLSLADGTVPSGDVCAIALRVP